MSKRALIVLFVLAGVMVSMFVACAPAPTPVPTQAPPTAAPKPTEAPKPTAAPTAAPAQPTAAPKPTEAAKATTAPTAAPQAVKCPLNGPLVIGMIQPVTGAAATVAKRVVSGATLAMEEINAKGGMMGCQVKLQVEDSQADPAVGVNAARKLLNQDKVQIIIGAYHSTVTLAVMPLLPDAKVPMLEVTATSPVITDQNNGWVFRTSSTNSVDAQTAVKRCWKDMKFNKIAFLYQNSDWGKSVPAGFEPTIKEMGGQTVLSEPVEIGATNFLSQLTKLRGSGADTVFVTTDIETTAVLAKQAFETGMGDKYIWIGTSGQNPEQFLALFKDNPKIGNGWNFISYYRPTYVPGGEFQLNLDFTKTFQARFSELTAEYSAASGYQGMYILKQALDKAGKYDGVAIRDALKTTDIDSLMGKVTFDAKGQAYPYVYFQQLKDSKYVVPCK